MIFLVYLSIYLLGAIVFGKWLCKLLRILSRRGTSIFLVFEDVYGYLLWPFIIIVCIFEAVWILCAITGKILFYIVDKGSKLLYERR